MFVIGDEADPPSGYVLIEFIPKGLSVGFITAAAMVHGLIEAKDEKRLLRLQRQLLLNVDELGYVPLSTTGAELLFEVFSGRSQ